MLTCGLAGRAVVGIPWHLFGCQRSNPAVLNLFAQWAGRAVLWPDSNLFVGLGDLAAGERGCMNCHHSLTAIFSDPGGCHSFWDCIWPAGQGLSTPGLKQSCGGGHEHSEQSLAFWDVLGQGVGIEGVAGQ